MLYDFWYHSKPYVKERPRSGKQGGKLYTPKGTIEAEKALAAAYDGPTFEGPLSMSLWLHPDKTHVLLEDDGPRRFKLQGDVDNYAKLVMDGLQGTAYDNDRQITRLLVALAC